MFLGEVAVQVFIPLLHDKILDSEKKRENKIKKGKNGLFSASSALEWNSPHVNGRTDPGPDL